ncbi:agmatinase [Pyrococcus abyssi]|uniref:Agmatinase n=1 Tax=Pyrococcus abyssi (strain GE5 / Orsay) TaxID=272844 RepID=Q9V2I5_PYRAB|nr:agmatinase [Pyrococcus abyssi]CAB49013.1 Agmatinase or arginase, arginase family protein [Pyrococcus abyssi GE5]CCE69465.1 TPA: agmatinase [Pyrococcus abyssi GE5]
MLLYTYRSFDMELPTVSIEEADYVIMGLPFDGTTSYKPGARFGPVLIRQATLNLESYILDYDVDIAELKIADAGDVALPVNVEDAIKVGIEAIKELRSVNRKALPIFLGGEHSMTYPPVAVLKPKSYVVFDAHLDLRDSYQGSRFNHACVARRIHENGVEVAIFGVRSGTREEVKYATENGIEWVHARDYNFDAFVDLVASLSEPIYVSIDIDVFDIPLVPETGTPEPGGLRFWDVVNALEWLTERKNVVGFDIMEVSGDKLGNVTSITAAKLLFHILGMSSR